MIKPILGLSGLTCAAFANKIWKAWSSVIQSIRDYLREGESLRLAAGSHGRLSGCARQLLAGIKWSNRVVHQTSTEQDHYLGMGSTPVGPKNAVEADICELSCFKDDILTSIANKPKGLRKALPRCHISH